MKYTHELTRIINLVLYNEACTEEKLMLKKNVFRISRSFGFINIAKRNRLSQPINTFLLLRKSQGI